jgi:adenylate kinase family enzyme
MGCSGSGKSTLAGLLAEILSLPHIELDSLFHQPNWKPLEQSEFVAAVEDAISRCQHGWIADGNYNSSLGDLLEGQATTVLWFDLKRPQVMYRVIRRSITRALTRTELWNGNREHWRNLFKWDPEDSIIRWTWTRHGSYHDRLSRASANAPAGQQWIRLSSQSDVDRLLHNYRAAGLAHFQVP